MTGAMKESSVARGRIACRSAAREHDEDAVFLVIGEAGVQWSIFRAITFGIGDRLAALDGFFGI